MNDFKSALGILAAMMVITGAAYPVGTAWLAVMVGQPESPRSLIGREFKDPKHFWGRPSATAPQPYNGGASSGSNHGPLNKDLAASVKARIEALRAADPGNSAPVPVDLVTASGSGLDPHITPEAARYQAPRTARLRGMEIQRVEALIEKHTVGRQWGFLGEPRVNVLLLNREMDQTR